MSELFLDEQSDNFIFLINLIKVNNYIFLKLVSQFGDHAQGMFPRFVKSALNLEPTCTDCSGIDLISSVKSHS